jgi:hypothetical protein
VTTGDEAAAWDGVERRAAELDKVRRELDGLADGRKGHRLSRRSQGRYWSLCLREIELAPTSPRTDEFRRT